MMLVLHRLWSDVRANDDTDTPSVAAVAAAADDDDADAQLCRQLWSVPF